MTLLGLASFGGDDGDTCQVLFVGAGVLLFILFGGHLHYNIKIIVAIVAAFQLTINGPTIY